MVSVKWYTFVNHKAYQSYWMGKNENYLVSGFITHYILSNNTLETGNIRYILLFQYNTQEFNIMENDLCIV